MDDARKAIALARQILADSSPPPPGMAISMWPRKAEHSRDEITLAKALIVVAEAHDAGYDAYGELIDEVTKLRAWATKLAQDFGVEVPPMLRLVELGVPNG